MVAWKAQTAGSLAEWMDVWKVVLMVVTTGCGRVAQLVGDLAECLAVQRVGRLAD